MTNFEKTRLTNKGIRLAATTGIEVNFTRIETGCGIYSVDEDVGDQECLKDKKQDYVINSIEKDDDDQISLKFCMTNETLQQTYLFTEIGVYALDQDGNEFLYAICFAIPENAQNFIAYNGRFICSMIITMIFGLSSDSTAVFDASGAYATYEDLKNFFDSTEKNIENVLNILNKHVENKENPHDVTAKSIGLDKVDNTSDDDKSVKYATSAGSATKATQDGNGNVIADTYATHKEIEKVLEMARGSGSLTKSVTLDTNTAYLFWDSATGGNCSLSFIAWQNTSWLINTIVSGSTAITKSISGNTLTVVRQSAGNIKSACVLLSLGKAV